MLAISNPLRKARHLSGLGVTHLMAALFLFTFSVPVWGNEEEPSRAIIEAFVASKIHHVGTWKIMEIGELDYALFADAGGNSGRISVKGKLVLRENLYEGAGGTFEAAVKSRLEDPELVPHGLRRAREAYGGNVEFVQVVNRRGNWSAFEGNVFFQREVGGWSFSVPMFAEAIRYQEPAGRSLDWFMRGQDKQVIEVGSPEFETIVELAVILGMGFEDERREFVARLEQFFQGEIVAELFRDDDVTEIFVVKKEDSFGLTKSAQTRGAWEFRMKGQAEFLQPLKRSFGRMEAGDIVPATLGGSVRYVVQIGQSAGRWTADMYVTLPTNWRVRENEAFDKAFNARWDEGRFVQATGYKRWRVISREHERGGPQAVGPSTAEDIGKTRLGGATGQERTSAGEMEEKGEAPASGAKIVLGDTVEELELADAEAQDQETAMVEQDVAREKVDDAREVAGITEESLPAGLLALAERRALTVRGLRGFGFLSSEEDRLVLSLRSRGIDVLSADVRDLRLWADVGGVEGDAFSEDELLQLRNLILKLETIEGIAGVTG